MFSPNKRKLCTTTFPTGGKKTLKQGKESACHRKRTWCIATVNPANAQGTRFFDVTECAYDFITLWYWNYFFFVNRWMGLTSAHTICALCCDLKSTLYQAQSTFSFFQQLFRNRKFLPVCVFVGGKKGTPYTFTYANFDYVSGALLPLLQHENIPEYYVNYKINRVYAWNSFRSPRPRRPHSNKKKNE